MTQGADTMNGANGHTLCRLDAMADGDAVGVEVMLDGVMESLIVLRQGQCARAYLNVCPHAGRRLDWAPGRFLLKDGILVCAVHGASFKAESGQCVGGPCRGASLHEIPVKVTSDGEVELA